MTHQTRERFRRIVVDLEGWSKEVAAMLRDTELLTEIRDLLQVMAEPLLEKRHKKFRDGIRGGKGKASK